MSVPAVRSVARIGDSNADGRNPQAIAEMSLNAFRTPRDAHSITASPVTRRIGVARPACEAARSTVAAKEAPIPALLAAAEGDTARRSANRRTNDVATKDAGSSQM